MLRLGSRIRGERLLGTSLPFPAEWSSKFSLKKQTPEGSVAVNYLEKNILEEEQQVPRL